MGVGDGDFHECNLVNVGGSWGYVDVTWGDTDDDFVYTHAYLGLTSDEMQRSGHTVTDGYSYPSVTGTGMDYFRRNNILYGHSQRTRCRKSSEMPILQGRMASK